MSIHVHYFFFFFFFFNDTATTEIYTLSLHDALPICPELGKVRRQLADLEERVQHQIKRLLRDRKSTRLNSSHSQISYAVFCLKKKKINKVYSQLALRGCCDSTTR